MRRKLPISIKTARFASFMMFSVRLKRTAWGTERKRQEGGASKIDSGGGEKRKSGGDRFVKPRSKVMNEKMRSVWVVAAVAMFVVVVGLVQAAQQGTVLVLNGYTETVPVMRTRLPTATSTPGVSPSKT